MTALLVMVPGMLLVLGVFLVVAAFRPEHVRARAGWAGVPAVRDGELHEVKSALILAPGPVAIREGLPALAEIIVRWAGRAPAGYSAGR